MNTVYTKHTIELLVNLSTSYFGAMSVKVSDLVKPYVDSNKSGDFSDWCEKLELVAGNIKTYFSSSFWSCTKSEFKAAFENKLKIYVSFFFKIWPTKVNPFHSPQ